MERLNSLNDVQTDQHRLLIVGEDVSLRQQEIQQLLEFARHGMTVLMTNPKKLEIPLDAATYLADKPSSMRFFNQVSLTAKPLSAYAISHQQALVKGSLHLTENRSGVSVEVRNDNFGWRWFELNFESRGKLLVGSYSLVQETKNSPSLLYFLKELIEAVKLQT